MAFAYEFVVAGGFALAVLAGALVAALETDLAIVACTSRRTVASEGSKNRMNNSQLFKSLNSSPFLGHRKWLSVLEIIRRHAHCPVGTVVLQAWTRLSFIT